MRVLHFLSGQFPISAILFSLGVTNSSIDSIKRRLERSGQRWLLIFDNVEDTAGLHKYLPRRGNGSILLTTRANAVGSLATSIEVDTMSWMEGTELLLRRAQRFDQISDEQ